MSQPWIVVLTASLAAFGQLASGSEPLHSALRPAARQSLSQEPLSSSEPSSITPVEQPLTISTNRPSFNDTTSIVPIGHFQLETGYTFTFRDRDDVETQTHNAPELFARIPLLEDRLELQFGTSGYIWSRSDDGSGFDSTEGFSDMSVGLRLKVADQAGWRPRIAVQASTTTGIGTDGISNQTAEPTFKFLWSYSLEDGWGIYGTAGIGYLTAGDDRFIQGQGGICLSKTLSEKWSVYGEYYVFGPSSKGTDAAHYISGGAAYLITSRIQLDGRIGFGLNDEANNVLAGVGISFLF